MEIPPEEQYQLQKLKILTEVQDDLVLWAKKKVSIFLAVIAVVGLFGAGGFITLTVGEKIEKEMQAVDGRVLDAVKSAVQAETSAKQATEFAESERRRLTKSANGLEEVVKRIQSEAETIENKLKNLAASIEGSSENVRGEAVLLTSELEKRIQNLEEATQSIAANVEKDVAREIKNNAAALQEKAQIAKKTYNENGKYQIQIIATGNNVKLAEKMQSTLRKKGYRIRIFDKRYASDFKSQLFIDWGIKLEDLDEQITIMHASDNISKSEAVRAVLKNMEGVADVKLKVDIESKSKYHIGVILPSKSRMNP